MGRRKQVAIGLLVVIIVGSTISYSRQSTPYNSYREQSEYGNVPTPVPIKAAYTRPKIAYSLRPSLATTLPLPKDSVQITGDDPWKQMEEEPPQRDVRHVHFPIGPLSEESIKRMTANGLNVSKVATTLEMLDQPQMLPVLLHFMTVLSSDWTFRIYHSKANAAVFQAPILRQHIDSGKLTLIEMNLKFESHLEVSQFFAYRPFWDNLAPAKYVLMFQFDSIICSKSLLKPEDFLEYDFIGAPVNAIFNPHENITIDGKLIQQFAMNGGLAIRNRDTMLRIIDDFGPFHEEKNKGFDWEDQFFVTKLRESGGRLPSLETAKRFSVESVQADYPMGTHQAERFLWKDKEYIASLMAWCPEMRMLPRTATWYPDEGKDPVKAIDPEETPIVKGGLMKSILGTTT